MMKSITLARSLARFSSSRAMASSRVAVFRTFSSAGTWAHHDHDEPSKQQKEPKTSKLRSAHVDAKIPENDYYEGHLMADHLEYLDDVLEKSIQLESELGDLQKIYDQKKKAYTNVGWMESNEIDQLFEDAQTKKLRMKQQLAELQALLQTAKRTVAVDAPDGLPDDVQLHELEEVEHIIDDAALHEDKDAILRQRAADAANRKVLGVDAPDGLPDDVQSHELEEVEHLIDDAARMEDKDKIVREHKMADAVRKERARDPEHDW